MFILICIYSTFQDGFELPSRLSVSAADCFLAITGALTRKAEIPVNRSKSINSSRSDPAVALVPTNISKKKVSQAHEPSCINGKMELLLWNHLEELIVLVQSLLAVCYGFLLLIYMIHHFQNYWYFITISKIIGTEVLAYLMAFFLEENKNYHYKAPKRDSIHMQRSLHQKRQNT